MLTIAAPCILPLLPILLGTSIGQTNKFRPVFIILGFISVFSVVALLLAFLASHLGISPDVFRKIAVVVLAVFGVLLIWPKPFEMLVARYGGFFMRASTVAHSDRPSNFSGFILGMTLGLVWTPCAGPVLGSILTLIASQRELGSAVILLIAYAIGASLPMLVIAYGGQYISNKVGIISRYSQVLQQFFGVLIVVLAVAIYFNYDIKIYSVILQHYPSYNVPF